MLQIGEDFSMIYVTNEMLMCDWRNMGNHEGAHEWQRPYAWAEVRSFFLLASFIFEIRKLRLRGELHPYLARINYR